MTNNDKYYDDTIWAPVVKENKKMLLDTALNDENLMLRGAAHDMFIYLTGLEERGLAQYKVCMFTKFNAESRGNDLYDYGDETKGDAFFEIADRIEISNDDIYIVGVLNEYKEYRQHKELWKSNAANADKNKTN